MENFIFDKNGITQHIVKYGVDIRPPVSAKQDRDKLQEYCNFLTDNYPQAFESLLIGPDRSIVQKTFVAGNDKRIEFPTFAMTPRGPIYTFPVRLFIEHVEDFDIADKSKIFRSAIEKFRATFAGRKIVRVGVVNEMIFDCGQTDSVQIVSNAISKRLWREGLRNIAIHLENPRDDKYNVNLDLAPAYAQQVVQSATGTMEKNVGFGVSVKVDINNQKMTDDLDKETIAAILAFAEDYVPEELVEFLNSEPE